jgi:hypothetical protein
VRIFLDECVDWRLSREFLGHEVKTARQMGWSTIENGTLLALASEQFDVFVTIDQNLPYQQNLAALPIAVAVLQARTSRLADLRLLVPSLLRVLESLRPGSAKIVTES